MSDYSSDQVIPQCLSGDNLTLRSGDTVTSDRLERCCYC